MQDRYRNRFKVPRATNRLRGQIALEAARRLYPTIAPADANEPGAWLDAAGPNELYVAKRKAAAVLGHRVRPGDLPSDDEVREQLVSIWRGATGAGAMTARRRTMRPTTLTSRLLPSRRWPIISTGSPSTR